MKRQTENPDGSESRHPIDVEAVVRTCPNCSAELEERKCKLICPRCHYYMSCSDF